MIDYLPDTNVFSKVFKGDLAVTEFVENLEAVIDTTIYIECLQGSKSNLEKRIIKKVLDNQYYSGVRSARRRCRIFFFDALQRHYRIYSAGKKRNESKKR
ncbi:MAG: hypothetical protein ABI891_09075 [Acidobacteriota bacterium]